MAQQEASTQLVRGGPALVTPADTGYQVTAVYATEVPRIDGHIDEAIWNQAQLIDGFTQSKPDEGMPATQRTEVRVLFDDTAIYIAAMMYDDNPAAMVATVLRRDESHNDNDAFAVTFDTYHDHRNGYFFETNALGAKFDAQIIGEGGTSRIGQGQTFNRDWDVVWDAAGQRLEKGWSVEITIPFWVLRFDHDSMGVWGVNFRRAIRRNSEEAYWAPLPQQFDLTRLSLSGVLLGLERVARPKNFQMKPYARGDVGQFPAGPDGDPFATHTTDPGGDAGLDIKWSVTPNMTLDGTLNTDFAQVEADDVQINLTRFPLFFPEKREFFLENAGLFQFGSGRRGTDRVVGFHSRRIGIFAGDQVRLLGGARLSGKAGGWNIGALNMQTAKDDALALPSENQTVVRVRRELGSRSSVGALFTNRQAGGSQYNRQLGFDGRWAINDQGTFDGWLMKTWTPGLEGRSDWAGAANAQWATSTWNVTAGALQVGDIFNPELGFVSRTDIRAYDSTLMWTPFYPQAKHVRNMSPHVSFNYNTDLENRLLTRRWHFDWDVFLKRGDKISVAHNRIFEQLDEPFEIVQGVVIVPGAYKFEETEIELRSDKSRTVWAEIVFKLGSFWDGDKKELQAAAGFRVGARLDTSLRFTRNDVELSGGEFVADIWRLRMAYDFSTHFFLSGLLQYDNLSDQLQTNLRLNYIHAAESDIFLVYNERRLREDPSLIDRSIILKVTKLFRL